jgi:NAD(P)H-hydrate epimerase
MPLPLLSLKEIPFKMIKIVSNDQMRAMDDFTIQSMGVPGLILMENAGRHTYECIGDFLAENDLKGRIDVYCGKGNNGGDGFVIARHLFVNGYPVQIFSVGNPEKLGGDAKINYRICRNYKIPITIISTPDQLNSDHRPALVVDALLGTGIKGAVHGLFADVIDHINTLAVPVVSVDIPSGLNGDSSSIDGKCITADLTVTMALPKRAHIFYPAKTKVGQLEIANIGMPATVKEDSTVMLNLVEYSDLHFPIIDENANKYNNGKLFVLAGSTGMTGAASLAVSAALRTGVGLINIGIPESLNSVMEVKVTEALTVPLPETHSGTLSMVGLEKIKDRINWADAIIIGPGCGREEETLNVLIAAINYCNEITKPILVDADALFALSHKREILDELGSGFLLTPHYGEFRRLVDFSSLEIETTPWSCLQTFLQNKSCSVNLKGAPSMVAIPDGQIFVNPTGNPGLAKGGSGDVLAGIIGGLMARGINPRDAAITGNFVHGEAADLLLVTHGAHSLLPSDLIQVLPEILSLY